MYNKFYHFYFRKINDKTRNDEDKTKKRWPPWSKKAKYKKEKLK